MDLRDEDRGALAEYQYRVAQQRCGNCLPYHAMWGYVQLAGFRRNSLVQQSENLETLIGEHASSRARILIAGAADATSLALTAQATKDGGTRITVADHCETPLDVCRAFAKAHGIAASTVKVDLAEVPAGGAYNLVFAHVVLMFIAKEQRVGFLRNLRSSLAEGGRLLLIHKLRYRKADGAREHKARLFAQRVIDALSERGIGLPDEEVRFRQGLEKYCLARDARDENPIGFEEVEADLAAAGFKIARRIDHRRAPVACDDDAPPAAIISTRIFIAGRET